MTQEPQKSHIVLIVIAIIGAIGTICATSIGAYATYNVEKLRQESELTRIALVSIVATQGVTTQVSVIAISETPIPTLLAPSNTSQAEIPPTLPIPTSTPALTFPYGVLGQGQQQTTLTSPGVCALYFYPFGGTEKTFVFSSGKQLWVQNYNGTLSCWKNTPSLADVGTNHPFADYNEVQRAGVVFSEQITDVDPNTLK